MFSKDRKQRGTNEVETVVGKKTTFRGEIETDGSLRIEGSFEGNIKSRGDVFIGKESRIKADLVAKDIIIAGRVEGDICTKGKLEILPEGRLTGDIKVSRLVIKEGAFFEGQSENYQAAEKKTKKSNDQGKKKSKKSNMKEGSSKKKKN